METACRSAAVATARLAMKARLVMPAGGVVTDACSARRSVVDEEPEEEGHDQQRGTHGGPRAEAATRAARVEVEEDDGRRSDEEEEARVPRARDAAARPAGGSSGDGRMDDAVATDEERIERVDDMEEEVHATGPSLAEGRMRRPGGPATYKEAGQRRRRRHRTGAATGTTTPEVRYVDGAESRRRELRLTIEVGPLAVDRTTGGRYEWRDGGLSRPESGTQGREPG